MSSCRTSWKYIFELLDEGYKLELDSSWEVPLAIKVKLTKGIYHYKDKRGHWMVPVYGD